MAGVNCSSLYCTKPASRQAVSIIDRATRDSVEVWLCPDHAKEAQRAAAEEASQQRASRPSGFLQRVKELTAS
jgi:hypothetical protein